MKWSVIAKCDIRFGDALWGIFVIRLFLLPRNGNPVMRELVEQAKHGWQQIVKVSEKAVEDYGDWIGIEEVASDFFIVDRHATLP